jgi:HAD superfamily phosphatase (TIGR01668 family)
MEKIMLEKLKPHLYVDDIHSIDYDLLINQGIKGIIFDIDNTLIPYEENIPREATIELINNLKSKGFQLVLASNGPAKRVADFNLNLNLHAMHRSLKPLKRNLQKAMVNMNLKNNEIAIIGDQIFTDVLAGNRAGMFTILVKPISAKKSIIEYIKRKIEDKLLQKFNKKA